MNTPTKLFLFGAGLAVVFGVMFLAGRALIPDETVATWTREANESAGEHGESGTHGSDSGHQATGADSEAVTGLSIEQDGYRMSAVKAPAGAGEKGELSFRILDPAGAPLTEYRTNHEKDLHLIAVRSDGAEFRHVHPKLDSASGTWSLPWNWNEAGNYRVFADFVPGGATDSSGVTLSRSVEVGGDLDPFEPALSREDRVDGFEVTLSGDLKAGESRGLTATITRGGEPVTTLQPYLGAFGHLVALREGDLAYLHVHAGEEHEADAESPPDDHAHSTQAAGPEINFMTETPTPGRYLMYLDFKVDGSVHTAEFVLEAK